MGHFGAAKANEFRDVVVRIQEGLNTLNLREASVLQFVTKWKGSFGDLRDSTVPPELRHELGVDIQHFRQALVEALT
jgi:hypothetical protein